MIYFTSDTHFDHKNVLTHRTQFDSIEKMNGAIVNAWNSVVGCCDEVWHLGDFGWIDTNYQKHLNKLNGNIHLIMGNHESKSKDWYRNNCTFASVRDIGYIKYQGKKISLCHYPMRTWRSSHYGSWHLHGHCHGSLPDYNRSTDVGLDAKGFKPVSFHELMVRFKDISYTKHH